MENSLYFDILKTARTFGIGMKADVVECFIRYSLEATTLADAVWKVNGRKKDIVSFLNRMVDNGHIISADVQTLEPKDTVVKKWDNFHFSILVILSPNGFKYLQEIELNDSINSVNQSTLANNKFQKRSQIINLIFALITTIFVGFTGYIAITDKSDKELAKISNELKQMKESLNSKKSLNEDNPIMIKRVKPSQQNPSRH